MPCIMARNNPNINRLIKNDTIYFDRFYSNIGKGNTADAEFSALNNLYPIIDGEVYRLYEIIPTTGCHAYEGAGIQGLQFMGLKVTSGAKITYPYQGFEDFISMEDMEQDEIIEWYIR